jgi:hypothetical protein
MSQGRINPAMLMHAAAAMAALCTPGSFGGSTKPHQDKRHPKASRKIGKINRKASPGYGVCAIAFNSGIKKRMRRARREAA